MVLSGETIKKYVKEGEIKIDPYDESQVGAVSVDLRLGNQALNPDSGKEINLQDYHLSLDEFLLANPIETITLPSNLVARIIPRSSFARLGILVTFDADLLPPNYSGKPILTMKNLSKKPVLLRSGLAICQLLFEEVDSPVEGYRSRYDHTKPEPSKLEGST
ncbi:MAG: dCTP deaminase [Candidatus Woykebacteria bacterium RBG_13_40_15]|uniref:dCTP deaminase n=1 Tax=Candidatus Woykebacteria bacterium RBG_13_40_15 TaxID=1802593 RepID=A0A1G1W6D4_9BACT|nr:MAG: dCTP deaminase [Candidatus Woykebacteria bacterium RBG_13_40_15]